MKDIAKFFLKNKALSWLLLGLILIGGVVAYNGMGKLEDAPFTIKQAVVTTTYPGASPLEVQQQVTDVLEESIQSLGELYYLKTDNRAGLSKITVYVKKEICADAMQQLWDKLRRKVSDVQSKLPAGAGPSVVNDDFGDVLGVFYSLSSDTRTYRELEDQAKRIKNELLGVKDVAKVELFGIQSRTIEVNVNQALMSQSGISMADIAAAFDRQNRVVDAGGLETGSNRLRIEATGSFSNPPKAGTSMRWKTCPCGTDETRHRWHRWPTALGRAGNGRWSGPTTDSCPWQPSATCNPDTP